MIIVILTPIIPAYIFYKVIPTKKTEVEGTFGSLRYKLSGSFGGYFLVFFILIALYSNSFKSTHLRKVWEVKGKVKFEDGNGNCLQLKIGTKDPAYTIPLPEGFKATVFSQLGENQNVYFPYLDVGYDGYYNETIDLNDQNKVNIDRNNKIISIREPIILHVDTSKVKN